MRQDVQPTEELRPLQRSLIAGVIVAGAGPAIGGVSFSLFWLIYARLAFDSASQSVAEAMSDIVMSLMPAYLLGGIPALIAGAIVARRIYSQGWVSLGYTIFLALVLSLASGVIVASLDTPGELPQLGPAVSWFLLFGMPILATALILRALLIGLKIMRKQQRGESSLRT